MAMTGNMDLFLQPNKSSKKSKKFILKSLLNQKLSQKKK